MVPLQHPDGRRAVRENSSWVSAHEIGGEHRQTIEMILRVEAIFDCDILALYITSFAQALFECGHTRPQLCRCPEAEITDHRHCGLLCARNERPCDRRSAKCGYELPSADADNHLPRPNGIKIEVCGRQARRLLGVLLPRLQSGGAAVHDRTDLRPFALLNCCSAKCPVNPVPPVEIPAVIASR